MIAPLRVVVVNGSPHPESKTLGLVSVITDALARRHPITVEIIDVYGLGPSFTGALSRDDLDSSALSAVVTAETSDLLIAATPVFRGSYTGMFKHFFDLVDQYALANKPVILAATGGSERHALVIEHALRPLLGFFQAFTVPVGFYASSADFDGNIILNAEIYGRVDVGLDDISSVLLDARTPASRDDSQDRGRVAENLTAAHDVYHEAKPRETRRK